MSISEFYQKMGVDYSDVLRRLGSEALIRKYLYKLSEDPSFSDLKKRISEADYERAFLAAHTLKGISLNLELKPLAVKASELTELLREGGTGKEETIGRLLTEISESYGEIVDAIDTLR